MEDHPVRDRGAQSESAKPGLVDLDRLLLEQVDPDRERRAAFLVAGDHQRAVKTPGARAECLHPSQHPAADHGGRLAFAGHRIPAPDAAAQLTAGKRLELPFA